MGVLQSGCRIGQEFVVEAWVPGCHATCSAKFHSCRAEREEFLVQQRAGAVETVPQLQQRLLQRRQIIDSLTKWTGSVLKKEGWVGWLELCRGQLPAA